MIVTKKIICTCVLMVTVLVLMSDEAVSQNSSLLHAVNPAQPVPATFPVRQATASMQLKAPLATQAGPSQRPPLGAGRPLMQLSNVLQVRQPPPPGMADRLTLSFFSN
jgi:hypothetical protein